MIYSTHHLSLTKGCLPNAICKCSLTQTTLTRKKKKIKTHALTHGFYLIVLKTIANILADQLLKECYSDSSDLCLS